MQVYQEDFNKLVDLHFNKLNQLLVASKKTAGVFTENEIEYLKEYLLVVTPITIGLDRLQSDKDDNAFFGLLVPTIHAIKKQLDKLQEVDDIRKLKAVAVELSECLSMRF